MQEDYPVELPSDGILVDDPGLDGTRPHKADIVNRIRNVLRAVWGAEGGENETEYEVARLFKAERLRDCFRRPGLFFGDHLNRHTVSRRKAPMYLPLSTSSGSYTIWLYYQRLSDQTLHTIINHFLEPKIADVRRAASRVEGELTDASGAKATELRDKLNGLKTFDGELEKMKQELLRVTALPYKPDRNDGVIISAAPLYKLFQHRSWAKECEKVWKKLEKGEYDWSHMAYNIWPDRVREKCRKDRSRAIAHGLEDICDVPPPGEKKKRSRAKKG